jgi:hypothetical protein
MIELVTAAGGTVGCFALLALPFLGVLGLVLFAVMRNRDERTETLKAFASRNRFAYRPGPDAELHGRLPAFFQFNMGSSGRTRNIITGKMQVGERLLDVIIGDFHYRTSKGSSDRRRSRSIAFIAVRLPWKGMPRFMVRPELFFERFASMLGVDDIDFESDEFSRRFAVTSSDRRFASDLIDPGMIEFMLANEPPGLVELNEDVACIGGTWSGSAADDPGSRLVWLGEFLDHWPEHLRRSLGEVSDR